jgi:inosine/guanosine/xanthosine phosphorylase family protein
MRGVDPGADATVGAAFLRERLGAPTFGVVLGSGFAGLARIVGADEPIPFGAVPEYPASRATGHEGGVAAATIGGANAWFFLGRLHAYEGYDALTAAHPVRLLAAAGSTRVVLTCAAGGLLPGDQPGDFAVVTDHLNLLGDDPLRRIPPQRRSPLFLDLQNAYDPSWAAAWRAAAGTTEAHLRDGILGAVPGPCYETPAEVRMLRALGADLASMSVVPETIVARYLGMRVAAIACISNRGAGMHRGDAIAHASVVDIVARAVAESSSFLKAGLEASPDPGEGRVATVAETQ